MSTCLCIRNCKNHTSCLQQYYPICVVKQRLTQFYFLPQETLEGKHEFFLESMALAGNQMFVFVPSSFQCSNKMYLLRSRLFPKGDVWGQICSVAHRVPFHSLQFPAYPEQSLIDEDFEMLGILRILSQLGLMSHLSSSQCFLHSQGVVTEVYCHFDVNFPRSSSSYNPYTTSLLLTVLSMFPSQPYSIISFTDNLIFQTHFPTLKNRMMNGTHSLDVRQSQTVE